MDEHIIDFEDARIRLGDHIVRGTAANGMIRAFDRSWYTDNDMRNVQTFPQDYDFSGKSATFICGVSVPPSMMANIAHEIREQWLS